MGSAAGPWASWGGLNAFTTFTSHPVPLSSLHSYLSVYILTSPCMSSRLYLPSPTSVSWKGHRSSDLSAIARAFHSRAYDGLAISIGHIQVGSQCKLTLVRNVDISHFLPHVLIRRGTHQTPRLLAMRQNIFALASSEANCKPCLM